MVRIQPPDLITGRSIRGYAARNFKNKKMDKEICSTHGIKLNDDGSCPKCLEESNN